MLSAKDLITLTFPDDLTQAGVQYACRSLAYTYNRMGGTNTDRLRRIAAGKAVELAFRRNLVEEKVPFDNLGMTPFTDPDHYDIGIGGRRCDIKSFLLYDKEKILRARVDSGYLLDASALVPEDQLSGEDWKEEDLFVFAFGAALVTRSRQELELALKAEQPVFLIKALPNTWAQPRRWAPLDPLALKSDLAHAIRVEVGGQNEQRQFVTETVSLPPHQAVRLKESYHAASYLRVESPIKGRVGIHSPRFSRPLIVDSHEWGNIWIYGMRIHLVGYITRGEYLRRAEHLPAGSQVLQYNRTRTANLSLPMRELHTLQGLYQQARKWGKRSSLGSRSSLANRSSLGDKSSQDKK